MKQLIAVLEVQKGVIATERLPTWVGIRSSHSQMFFKTGVYKSFAKLPGKHFCY